MAFVMPNVIILLLMLVVFLTVSRGEPGAAEAGHAGCAQMHCSCCACTLMRLDVPHR